MKNICLGCRNDKIFCMCKDRRKALVDNINLHIARIRTEAKSIELDSELRKLINGDVKYGERIEKALYDFDLYDLKEITEKIKLLESKYITA